MGTGKKKIYSYSSDHEEDWQPYPVDPYSAESSADKTYSPEKISRNASIAYIEDFFLGGGGWEVFSVGYIYSPLTGTPLELEGAHVQLLFDVLHANAHGGTPRHLHCITKAFVTGGGAGGGQAYQHRRSADWAIVRT